MNSNSLPSSRVRRNQHSPAPVIEQETERRLTTLGLQEDKRGRLRASGNQVQNERCFEMQDEIQQVMSAVPHSLRAWEHPTFRVLELGRIAVLISVSIAFGWAAPFQSLVGVQQLIEGGDLKTAREQLTKLLRASPQNPNALNMLGVIDAQEGKYRTAESDFQKAIAKAPRFKDPYLNLGRIYQQNSAKDSEAPKKALAVYERLLKVDPENLEATYQSAFILWQFGSFQTSLNRLARLPPEAQERPQALALRCGVYAGLKDLHQARSTAGKLLKHPDLVEADVLGLTPFLVAKRHEDLAAELLAGLEERHLATVATLQQLATLDEQTGKFQQARATLEKVAQQQSVSLPLLIALARVANKQGDNEGALGYLAHARELDPNNAGVHFFFGIVCVEMNLVQEAYKSLQKAVELDSNNPYYNYALGAVMTARDAVRESYPYLKKYCELKPQDPHGRLALGAAYYYGHDLDLARQELKSVVDNRETGTDAHFFLGRVANLQGQNAEAERELQQAIALNPRYANAYAELGVLRIKQKQYAGAQKDLEKALEIEPNHYVANLNLMILYQRRKDPRAEAQANRFDEIKKARAQRELEFLRTVQVRPY